MVLDKLEQSRVNIKDLVLDETQRPQPEFIFDPREVSEESWKGIFSLFNELKRQQEWRRVLPAASLIKIIDPERANQLELNDSDWDQIISLMKSEEKYSYDGENAKNFIGNFIGLKFISPQRVKEYNFNPPIQARSSPLTTQRRLLRAYLNDIAKGSVQGGSIYGAFMNVYEAKVAFPEENEIEIPENALKNAAKYAKDLYVSAADNKLSGSGIEFRDLRQFINLAAALKVIAPNQFLSFGIINEQSFEHAKYRLGTIHSVMGAVPALISAWDLDVAASLKIIAAQKVNITDHGLELVMSQQQTQFEQPKLSLPESRKF